MWKKLLSFSIGIFLFISTLVIYILTLSRSVYFGDSGEFIAVAKTLGIAHPPGYPLYTMISHLFTYFPFGSLPFTVNLFSAVTSSLTAILVFFIILKLTGNRIATFSASLFLAFSYLFWLYSTVAEVFSLNNLFVAAIILTVIYLFENPQNHKIFYLLAFLVGLALTNHHTILFLAPALLVLILSINKKLLFNLKTFGAAVLFFILGLIPYIYLPARASQNPALNWGGPDNLERFFDVILRRDYGTFVLSAGGGGLNFEGLGFYFSSLFSNFTLIGFILGLAGLFFAFKTNKKVFIFLILAYAFLGPIFILLTRGPIINILTNAALERFFLTSQVIWSIFVGIGFAGFLAFLPRPAKTLGWLLVLLVPFVLIFLNYQKVDQSKNSLYENFGRQIFATLPENSVVLTFTDKISMISTYLQEAQNERKDLKIIKFTFLPDSWYIQNLKQRYANLSFPYDKFEAKKLTEVEAAKIICQEVAPKHPTFIERKTKGFSEAGNPDCSYHSQGLLVKIENPAKKISVEEFEVEKAKFLKQIEGKLKDIQPFDSRTRAVKLFYAESLTNFGRELWNLDKKEEAYKVFTQAQEISADYAEAFHFQALLDLENKNFEKAIKLEEKAIQAEPTLSQQYKILGSIYLHQKNNKTKALFYFRKYLALAPSGPERIEVARLVRQLELRR